MANNTDFIRISLFKDSREPFVALLREHGIEFSSRAPRMGVPMASGEWVEVLKSISISAPFATVVVAFLKHRHSRKIIITTNDNTVVHAENLTHEELLQVLQDAKNLTVIETSPKEI